MQTRFKNANEAYNYFLNEILVNGVDFDDTKALFNIGFTIENPEDNHITNTERKWSLPYAEAEWDWYLSQDPRVEKLGELYGKVPVIWKRMADKHGEVNSNYGYQWGRHDQLQKVIDMIKENPKTRKAAISIYDGKEIHNYSKDTPCTYAVQFTVLGNDLNMSVVMRSNDIWYGFCNDQYCFSELQKIVAEMTGYNVGEYFHFAHNLHLYNNKL